jgi:quercetin dioxygenase-like cupin family protein
MIRIRRVVTEYDKSGRAVVAADETLRGVSGRAGHERCDLWQAPDGTVFRVVEFAPGVTPRVHRTNSIDYAVVVSGEIDMELDNSVVHLKAGDVLVQRGTIHNWVNRGSEPCVIAFILIDAKPVEIGGKVLHAEG